MATQESKLIISLIDRLTGPAKKVTAEMAALTAAAKRNAAAMSTVRAQLFDAVAIGYALAKSISAPVKASIEFEEKMADVKKVVDFETPAAFKEMGREIRAMSLRLPLAASAIADIVAAAGQSGIENKDLLRFTELASKVSVAWDLTAGETAEALAKLKTALGRSVDDTASLADALNHLGNKTAASSKQLLDFTARVAPMASTFGLTAEQAAAIGAAMIGAGFDADVASTSFLNAGYALTAGTNATKGQRDGFKKLGLSATKVSKAMQRDAVGTLDDVLSRIRKLPKEAQASTLQQIFGKEAKALAPLLTNAKLLGETLGYVADRSKYAGSAAGEYEVRSKTTANALQLFRNRLNDMSISIGDALGPGLNKALDTIGPFVTKISELAQKFPDVTSGIVTATTALVGFRVAMLALRFSGLFVAASLIATATSFVSFSAMMAPVTAAITAVGAALAAISAPIWLAIAVAVGLVAAAGSALYIYWDRITAVVTGVADAIGVKLQPVLAALQPVLDAMRPVLDAIGSAFSAIGDAAGTAWSKLKEFASGLSGIFTQEVLTDADKNRIAASAFDITTRILDALAALPAKTFEIGSKAIQALLDGMIAKFGELLAWVKEIPSKIAAAIGNIDLSNIITWPSLPSWAGGGTDTTKPSTDGDTINGGGSSTAIKGFRGNDDLFSGVTPANQVFAANRPASAPASSRSASPVVVNVGGIHVNGANDPKATAEAVHARLNQRVRQTLESADAAWR